MDEEVEVKAPVTRRRRNLSVEQSDDGKPSPAPGTPTKKRGGRKVTKPELELIEENEVKDNLKTTTRKRGVKEIKDNIEEKPVTPSRRSARIKSNTSLVSDTVQAFDSPRAKRASRRTSLAGSDTEMSLTPARQTRRRKDSTSSVEKQDTSPATVKTLINEAISEEPEIMSQVTKNDFKKSDSENSTHSPIRRSPRLLNKTSRSSNSLEPDNDNNSALNENDAINNCQSEKSNTEKVSSINTNNNSESLNNIIEEKMSKMDRLSISSANLIKDLDTNPNKKISHINNSLTEAQELNNKISKRHRTKSWSTITTVSLENLDFHSDNERTKKKHQSKGHDVEKITFNSGSGDCKFNGGKDNDLHKVELNTSQTDINLNKSSTEKKIKEISDKSFDNSPIKLRSKNEEEPNMPINSEIPNLFNTNPSSNIQTLLLLENSDSNHQQINTYNKNTNEDQCVPAIDHQSDNKSDYNLSTSFNNKNNDSIFKFEKSINSRKSGINDTCEPMDVDVTLPDKVVDNVSFKESEIQEESFKTLKQSRKSSINLSTSQNLEQSSNENKSTLILCELKDISESDNKSPQNSSRNPLSKSIYALNVTQESLTANKKLSLNYLTSTPMQQKSGTQDEENTNIFKNNIIKDNAKTTPKKNTPAITNSHSPYIDTESTTEEESLSNGENNLLDNEAEEANDSYESGDSQDTEEKQYLKDNEILEEGETLTSEDELSNDSDYDKDSFVVSSTEDDNELLDGTGHDLSMSDNELKMTKKSKNKYNERKLKEQKQASKEMFQSRHKINDSRNSLNLKQKHNSCQQLESSQSEDDVIGYRPKKNKRMRLSSIANESNDNSDTDNVAITKSDKDQTKVNSKPSTTADESFISIGFVSTEEVNSTPCGQNTLNSKSSDPLQNSDDSSSLSSEDINIVKNYDNILNDLKTKTADCSLNIDKKTKTKSKQNISSIDYLNLTQTKASSKINNKTTLNSIEINSNDVSLKLKNKGNKKNEASSINNRNFKEHTENVIALNANKVEQSNIGNLSLNLDKKSNKANKPSIVDQLNLTQIKNEPRKKNIKSKSGNPKNLEHSNCDDSSESINLNLLFSEESNNSTYSNKKSIEKTTDNIEVFIPLKKTEAKTDIRATAFDVSKNKSVVCINEGKQQKVYSVCDDFNDNEKEVEVPYFIDILGNRSKEGKDKKITEKIVDDSSDDESNVSKTEIVKSITPKSPKSENKKKKNNSLNQSIVEISEYEHTEAEKSCNKSFNSKTPKSEKKKNNLLQTMNKSNLLEHESLEAKETVDQSVTLKTPKSEKKKKNNLSQSLNQSSLHEHESIEAEEAINQSVSLKTPKSEKKKKNNLSQSLDKTSLLEHESVEAEEAIDQSVTSKTPKSKKKRNNLSESLNKSSLLEYESIEAEEAIDQSVMMDTTISEKKKKNNLSQALNKSNLLEHGSVEAEETIDQSLTIKAPKGKKKKRNDLSESLDKSSLLEHKSVEAEEAIDQSVMLDTAISDKKKKNNLSQSLSKSILLEHESVEAKVAIDQSVISKTPKNKKKKRNNLSESLNKSGLLENESIEAEEAIDQSVMLKTGKSEKNKKNDLSQSLNKSSLPEQEPAEAEETTLISDNKKISSNDKKQKRLSESINESQQDMHQELLEQSTSNGKHKKNKNWLPVSEPGDESKTSEAAQSDLRKDVANDEVTGDEVNDVHSKKRKRKPSTISPLEIALEVECSKQSMNTNESISSLTKKRKMSQECSATVTRDIEEPIMNEENILNPTKTNSKIKSAEPHEIRETVLSSMGNESQNIKDKKMSSESRSKDSGMGRIKNKENEYDIHNNTKTQDAVNTKPKTNKSKKRKIREDDEDVKKDFKVLKDNSLDQIHIPRLPSSLLNKLEDKPKTVVKKQKAISTTEFEVVKAKKDKNKPSNYLEESIYINEDDYERATKKVSVFKNPKVLPFIPTATTSNSGFTTNFKVNVIPQEIKFVAQSNTVTSFKDDYFYRQKINRRNQAQAFGIYKKNRNVRISKF